MEGTSTIWGQLDKTQRWLLLDGVLQISTSDEEKYHEALVGPVMLSHPSPGKVAVLGGGDGGALREVLNFNSVEAAHLVELDKRVVDVSREYLPSLSYCMAHEKGDFIFGQKANFKWDFFYIWLFQKADFDGIWFY